MIKFDRLTRIGVLLKPHGIKGEILLELDIDVDLEALRCVVLDIDGIFVPFFINSVRPRSVHSALITIDDINDDVSAKSMCGKDLYVFTEELDSEIVEDLKGGFYLSDLIGYNLEVKNLGVIGKISDFDDSTENYLLIVDSTENEGKKIFIPLAQEFITGIDDIARKLEMDLPEGLIELNN